MSIPSIKYCMYSQMAFEPTHGTEFSAGFDLYSPINKQIEANRFETFDTLIQFEIPRGYFGKLYDKSSLCKFFTVLGGVIDCDYTGSVFVVLHNKYMNTPLTIVRGQAICQIVFQPYVECTLERVLPFCMSETDRGKGCFGSTSASVSTPVVEPFVGSPLKKVKTFQDLNAEISKELLTINLECLDEKFSEEEDDFVMVKK